MKFKKLISCLAAAAMLTSLVPAAFAADSASDETPAALTINASGTNTFEIEEFYPEAKTTFWGRMNNDNETYKNRLSDTNASGGTYLSISWWGEDLDYTRKINVAEEGLYAIDMVASIQRDNLSWITVYVDGTEVLKNTDGGGSETQIPDPNFYPPSATNKVLHKYTKNVVLTKGEHTVRMVIPKYGTTGRVAASADTISFATAESKAIKSSGENTFEVEDFFAVNTNNRIIENTNASGGTYWSDGYFSTALNDTVPINVEEDGSYRIDFIAGEKTKTDSFSNVILKIDGNTLITNSMTTGVDTQIPHPWNTNKYLKKYTQEVYLTKGIHNLSITSDLQTLDNTARGAATADTISFTNVTKTLTAGAQQKSYEFEEVWAYPGRVKDDANASGDKFVNQTYEDYLPKKDYAKLNVEKDGFYKVNFVAEPSGEYLSRTTITVDGEGVVQNSINYESATESTTEVIGPGTKALKNYYGYIYLTKGEHELAVEYMLSVKDKTRHAYGFDKFSFTEVTPATLPENGGKIEAEGNFGGKLYNGNLTANTNASGGNLLFRQYSPSDVKEIVEAYVNVEKAGFYNVDLHSNKYEAWLSAVTMKIDGGEVLKSSSGNKGTQVSTEKYPNNDFPVVKHTANAPVYLTAGVHKIELEFKAAVDGGKRVCYSLDYVEFKPYDSSDMTFTSDLAEIAEYPFSVGDDPYPITVKCNDQVITNGSYQITYKSSNEAVVKVSEDGEITPMKVGYSDVSVTVGISGVTMATFSGRIYVLDDDNQKYISNVSYANGTVSFVATDYSDEEFGGFAGTAYVAVYNGDTLVNVKIVKLNANETEYTADIEIKSGETAKILVWDDNFAPIWAATDVK